MVIKIKTDIFCPLQITHNRLHYIHNQRGFNAYFPYHLLLYPFRCRSVRLCHHRLHCSQPRYRERHPSNQGHRPQGSSVCYRWRCYGLLPCYLRVLLMRSRIRYVAFGVICCAVIYGSMLRLSIREARKNNPIRT